MKCLNFKHNGIAKKEPDWTQAEMQFLSDCRQLGLSYGAISKQFADRKRENITVVRQAH